MQLAPKYGHYLRNVEIYVDQKQGFNRTNACKVINDIAKHRNLRTFKLCFIANENPTFYSGKEFIDALQRLFAAVNQVSGDAKSQTDKQGSDATAAHTDSVNDVTSNVDDASDDAADSCVKAKIPRVEDVDESSNLSNSSLCLPANRFDPNRITEGQLREVDLSGFSVCIDDSLISLLAQHHHDLEKLNIQNNVLVVKVSPASLLKVVQNCRKLRDLRVYMCSVSRAVLECLAEDDRVALQQLSLFCCRYEKYVKDIERDVWRGLVKKLPQLQVTLKFDHTCPLYRVAEIMKSEIPVVVLCLETQTTLRDEVLQAANFYGDTLERVVIKTPPERVGPTLDSAVLTLAQSCSKLKSLHVFYVLEEATIDRIFELHPSMKARGSYTLKHTPEPHPWVAGRDAL